MNGLDRFHAIPQDAIDRATAELLAGRKTGHWMWFVFPQIAGLGSSATARHYAIRDIAEARDFLADPLLASRLRAATAAILGWAGRRPADAILGGVDAIKLRSSMTLFEAAAAQGDARDAFTRCLEGFFDGVRDPATLGALPRRLPSDIDE